MPKGYATAAVSTGNADRELLPPELVMLML
jgi:hypothetical protein